MSSDDSLAAGSFGAAGWSDAPSYDSFWLVNACAGLVLGVLPWVVARVSPQQIGATASTHTKGGARGSSRRGVPQASQPLFRGHLLLAIWNASLQLQQQQAYAQASVDYLLVLLGLWQGWRVGALLLALLSHAKQREDLGAAGAAAEDKGKGGVVQSGQNANLCRMGALFNKSLCVMAPVCTLALHFLSTAGFLRELFPSFMPSLLVFWVLLAGLLRAVLVLRFFHWSARSLSLCVCELGVYASATYRLYAQSLEVVAFPDSAAGPYLLLVVCLAAVAMLASARITPQNRPWVGDVAVGVGVAVRWSDWLYALSMIYMAGMMWYIAWIIHEVGRVWAVDPAVVASGLYSKHLGPSVLLPGFTEDQADNQWNRFEKLLPLLVVFFGAFAAFGQLLDRYASGPVDRARKRLVWYVVSGVVFLGTVFGATVLLILLYAAANYVAVRSLLLFLPSKAPVLGAVYALNIAGLVVMPWLTHDTVAAWLGHPGWFYAGLMDWTSGGYFMTLKMLSYSVDCVDVFIANEGPAAAQRRETRHADGCVECSSGDVYCYKRRQYYQLQRHELSPLYYFAYILYAPTFFAGPTISFAPFVSHFGLYRQPRRTKLFTTRLRVWYVARWLIVMVLYKLMQSLLPVFAVMKYMADGRSKPVPLEYDVPILYFGLGYFALKIIYLKFYLLWRFFRSCAVLDGVEPPENLTACISTRYSASGFWRNWHASYNLWLVRYIYIPLGGNKNRVRNVICTFAWVIWTHDPQFENADKYVVWGGMMAGAIAIEALGHALMRKLFPGGKAGASSSSSSSSSPSSGGKSTFRSWKGNVQAIGCLISITILLMGNMIAYAFGSSDSASLVGSLTTTDGLAQVAALVVFLFVAVHVMRYSEVTIADTHRRLLVKKGGARGQ